MCRVGNVSRGRERRKKGRGRGRERRVELEGERRGREIKAGDMKRFGVIWSFVLSNSRRTPCSFLAGKINEACDHPGGSNFLEKNK